MSEQVQTKTEREIAQRLVVRGDLTLLGPAHLGNGDSGGSTDMPLLLDALERRPLLTGSSLAGALRAYLLTRSAGYAAAEQARDKNDPRSIVELLFGGAKGDAEGDQSPLIVDDALAQTIVPEIRDGVRIDACTRTAQEGFKFDAELLPPGTVFPLRFELLLSSEQQAERLAALALALEALELGAISIGGRKTRGFGRCTVAGWRVARFDLHNKAQLHEWLTLDEETHPALGSAAPRKTVQEWQAVFGQPAAQDARDLLLLTAQFKLASPILIRAELPLGDGDDQPDFVHLRDALDRPVLSGTSLAGALRARALRILNTLGQFQDAPDSLLNTLFGKDMQQHKQHPTASRLIVDEAVIANSTPLVQSRVSIDRFTGGALDTALFNEAPEVGGEVTLTLRIRNPQPAEIGLLLLLLKDLWLSDLRLGGASSIGRGQLQGHSASLTRRKDNQAHTVAELLQRADGTLAIEGDRAQLQGYVDALTQRKPE